MVTIGLSKQGGVAPRRMIGMREPDAPIEALRSLSRPSPPPWLRDRVLAEVYAMERRKRRLHIAARYGAVGLAVLFWGAGTVCLCWAIAH